jgi:hypothetical protein
MFSWTKRVSTKSSIQIYKVPKYAYLNSRGSIDPNIGPNPKLRTRGVTNEPNNTTDNQQLFIVKSDKIYEQTSKDSYRANATKTTNFEEMSRQMSCLGGPCRGEDVGRLP